MDLFSFSLAESQCALMYHHNVPIPYLDDLYGPQSPIGDAASLSVGHGNYTGTKSDLYKILQLNATQFAINSGTWISHNCQVLLTRGAAFIRTYQVTQQINSENVWVFYAILVNFGRPKLNKS